MSYIFSFDVSPESNSVVFDWATWQLADSSGIMNDNLDLESMVQYVKVSFFKNKIPFIQFKKVSNRLLLNFEISTFRENSFLIMLTL